MFIKPSTLNTANLSTLLREQWFATTLAAFQAAAAKLNLTSDGLNLSIEEIDVSSASAVQRTVKRLVRNKDYLLAAHILTENEDVLAQSALAYAIALNNINLLMALLAQGQNVNQKCYQELNPSAYDYPLTLAMAAKQDPLFNLLLLHPQIDAMYEQVQATPETGDVYVRPSLRLFSPAYRDVLPYLNLDLNRHYASLNGSLFNHAVTHNDIPLMTLLHALGADIFHANQDGQSPFTMALHEFNRTGSSTILNWYGDTIRPTIARCTQGFNAADDGFVYSGLLALLQDPIDPVLIDQFGLSGWSALIEDKRNELYTLKHKQRRTDYRVLYPNLFKPAHTDPNRFAWFEMAEDFVVDELHKDILPPEQKIAPLSVFEDIRRIYSS